VSNPATGVLFAALHTAAFADGVHACAPSPVPKTAVVRHFAHNLAKSSTNDPSSAAAAMLTRYPGFVRAYTRSS
jgi:hypothetical protein